MGHSFFRLCYHIVFAPKYRRAVLRQEIEQQVWDILREVSESYGIYVHAVGGFDDHVHLVLAIPASMSVADAVRIIKSVSSRLIKERIPSLSNFSWQVGYSAFTVRYKDVGVVIRYVKNQRKHHTKPGAKAPG